MSPCNITQLNLDVYEHIIQMGIIRKFDVVQGHGIMTQETQLWHSSEVENASQN